MRALLKQFIAAEEPNKPLSDNQLSDLLKEHVPRLQDAPYGDHPVLSIRFESLDDEIYAPTAAMIYQFREVALAGRATRVAHFEQPRFAWC